MAPPVNDEPVGQPPGAFEARALWWARFIVQYGALTVLSVFLLAIVFGFISSPMLTANKPIEVETRDGLQRLESQVASQNMRFDTLSEHITEYRDGLREQLKDIKAEMERQTCLALMSPTSKAIAQRARSEKDIDVQCTWLRSGVQRSLTGEVLPK